MRASVHSLVAGVALAVIQLLVVAGTGSALTFNVTSTLDLVDSNPGDEICSPCTLRAAVQEANLRVGDDSIWLQAGSYTLTLAGADEDDAATGDLDILDDVIIAGVGAGATVVDAGGIDRVFHVVGDASLTVLRLHGMTVTGGSATSAPSNAGGGVLVGSGGSRLYLNHCTLSGNTAGAGGAVWLASGGWTEISYSTLSGNSSVPGSGANEQGAALGGELDGTLWMHSSTVSGNTSSSNQRNAISLDNGGANIDNCTISGNTGAGFRSYNTSALIVNATIVDNGGFGISFGSFTGEDLLGLRNTIVADNLGDCYLSGGNYIHSGNLDSDGSCGLDSGAGELPSTAPMLGALAANGGPTLTHAPLDGSPVVDSAGTDANLAVDQRGVPRPQGAARDIGAVESVDLIFVDTFESFSTSFWSAVEP